MPAKQRGPKRPEFPNTKGLRGFPMLPVKMHPALFLALNDRARYDTLHWRLEHDGQGRVISPQDIVRRLIVEYFKNVSPVPDDAIGAVVRAEKRRPEP